ncbi:hypothetical protein K438DRAFT_663907 [Mycena galopus ATCC 62051]|nr:hypothetical protein K438DRAFT_663907 [Mycena galopus ATCC 62051]
MSQQEREGKGGSAPALLLLVRRGRRGGVRGGGEGQRAAGRAKWRRASGRCRRTLGWRCGIVRQGSRMKRKGTTQHRCDDTGYSTAAHGARDPCSVAIHRPSPVTLPLGRSEVSLNSRIETHTHLPRNRCRSQPRTPHPALYGQPSSRLKAGLIPRSSHPYSVFRLGLGLRWDSPDAGSNAGSEERMGATRAPWTPTPHIRTRLALPTAPPSAHLRYLTASSVPALESIQITIQII